MIQRIVDWFKGIKRGEVTDIAFTWGGAGNQLTMINDIRYATWMNYTEFPPRGAFVVHKPYYTYINGRRTICTKILEVQPVKR